MASDQEWQTFADAAARIGQERAAEWKLRRLARSPMGEALRAEQPSLSDAEVVKQILARLTAYATWKQLQPNDRWASPLACCSS